MKARPKTRAKARAKARGKARPQKEKGPSGPDLPRKRFTDLPISGEVVSWKGKIGWIMPTKPVDHPDASKHEGKIYVNVKDIIDGDALDKGTTVHFQVLPTPVAWARRRSWCC